jgi:subtilase family serine protease
MKKCFWVTTLLVIVFSVGGMEAIGKAPSAKQPDLTITKAKATQVKGTTKVTITYTIKNQGNATSEATTTVVGPLGGKLVQQKTPPLDPGETFSASYTKELGEKGYYQFRLAADYINVNQEKNENNNENVLRFSIGHSL